MDMKTLRLEELGLSNRSQNALYRKGVRNAEDLMKYDEKALYRVPHLGKKSVEEILAKIAELKDYEPVPEQIILPSSAQELIRKAEYGEKVVQYVRSNDLPVESMPLTPAKIVLFHDAGWHNLSDIILLSDDDFRAVQGMGKGMIDKLRGFVDAYLKKNEDRMLPFCCGDSGALWDDAAIGQQILDLYGKKGFGGFSLAEMTEALALPEEFSQDRLKKIIGGLLAAEELEYVDFRCYRVYDRFEEYLARCIRLDERERLFVQQKLDGKTLEEIGQQAGITRERVRQVIAKAVDKVRSDHRQAAGQRYFDEEYFLYLYEKYDFNPSEISTHLGVTPSAWRFLALVCDKRGKKDLQEAQDDANLDAGIRYRIRNYLNRRKVFIDGVWVDKTIGSLEDVVIEKFCRDDTSFKDFPKIYNDFLDEEGIEGETVRYRDGVIQTRKNKLAASRNVLWKEGERFRYYDIDARDYTELLDALNLDAFENVEYSTEKFLHEYPEIMAKYDIRDQYELHNLLRKTVPDGEYHDFHCGRMPNIYFGKFDWPAALNDMLISLSPVSQKDLVEAIHREYGYDPGTVVGTYLGSIAQYYHQGIYSVDWQEMPAENRKALQEHLPEDFYYLNEVRKIYADLFPDADPEDVNPYNLKQIGFQSYSGYVLQHYDSADRYFTELLTKDDFVDLRALKDRYGYIIMFSNRLMDLKKSLQLIEYEPDKAINLRRLENGDVTKEQLLDFCNEVYEFAEDGTYFTMQSLKEDGFISSLFDLGFDDWFYSNLLLSDPRLSFNRLYNNLVFYKGKQDITIKSFELDRVREYGKIDALDLFTELTERYGCRITDRTDVVYKLRGTSVYHDRIQDRLYINEDLYYQEIDGV